jgi:carbonic anhydrase
MTKDIDQLIQGYLDFRQKYFEEEDSSFQKLVERGQRPKILVIACSDSRVDPAIVLKCEPGDLFVVRNVANLVPPYEPDNSYHSTSAALEFAVCQLGIKHIIVFGHTQCGGIQACLEGSNNPNSFIGKWMQLAQSARERTLKELSDAPTQEQVHACGRYALMKSLENLYTFPWIKELAEKQHLHIHGWYFELAKGRILAYNKQTFDFEELVQSTNLE